MRKLSRDPLREAILKCLVAGSMATAMNVYADCNIIYGVHDEGLNNSQFVTIDRGTYAVSPLGAMNPGRDIEGLDMNKAHELYGSSGDDPEGHPAGHLYKISTVDGSPQSIGDICFDVQDTEVCGTEVSAISFNPINDDLWGWSEECGLIKIDINTPENSTLEMPYSTDELHACLSNVKRQRQKYTSTIEDLSWDSDGKKIYYANGDEVYVYTPLTGSLEGPLGGVGLGGNVETVEMLPDSDKTLILIVDGSPHLFNLDIATDTVSVIDGSNIKPYTDIEAVATCIEPSDDDDKSGDDDIDPVETVSCDKMGSNIFAKFNWDGSNYVADDSAANNDSITINADGNGGTWSATDAAITHVVVNTTDANIVDGATDGSFNNSDGITTVEFCGTPVVPEPPQITSCPDESGILLAKFEWNGSNYAFEKPEANSDVVTITGDAENGTWSATTANINYVILKGGTSTGSYAPDSAQGETFSNTSIPVNGGGNIPDISNIQFCGTMEEVEPVVVDCDIDEPENEWLYATDAVGDRTGDNGFEIYGTAVKQDGDTIIVAISANSTPENPVYYQGENINFTDYVFDFSGTKYAIHFAPDNDSGANAGIGLYENVTFKDVTKKNIGWSSFSSYNRGDLGDLPIHNNYFSWDAQRSVPQEIDSGTKIANDGYTRLTEAELTGMGLDFVNGLTSGQTGTYTFGFSFNKTADMEGDFVSYVFTECINDGIALVNTLPAPMNTQSCPEPTLDSEPTSDPEPIPDPEPTPDPEPILDPEPTDTNASCDVDGGDSVTLAAGGGSNSFTIEFLGKTGNDWSYKVSQTGRDLSHWSLGIENCEGKVVSSSPSSGFESGQGGRSDRLLKDSVNWMVKWDTDGGVADGQVFTLTVDDDYAATDVGVLVKTGGNPKSALGTITAPNCGVAPANCGAVTPELETTSDPKPTLDPEPIFDPEPTTPVEDTDYIAPINPTTGSATVDGDISEWNLNTDLSANMCTAGSVGSDGNCAGNGKVNLSDLYSRYDCDTNTMYVLVLENAPYEAERSESDAWVTIGGNSNKVVKGSSGNDGTAPDFSWVENASGRTIGYEASFPLDAGTYDNVQVHLNVSNNTSSTGKNGDTASITTPASCPVN